MTTSLSARCVAFFIFCSLFTLLLGCKQQKVAGELRRDSFAELTRLLGPSISKHLNNGMLAIEYSPDNTSESFSMPSSFASEKLSDFVFLYLYFVSDYYYLDDFRKRVPPNLVSDIISRNRQSRVTKDQLEDAKQSIALLATECSIKATFVRYDESHRTEEAIDIRAELSKVKQP